jgi:integrase
VLIDTKKIAANKTVLDFANEQVEVSSEQIKAQLQKKKVIALPVLKYFDHVYEQLCLNQKLGTAEAFRNTRRVLSNFRDGKDFSFLDITPAFLGKFEEYCIGRGNQLTTRSFYMRTFQRLVNLAKGEGFVKKEFDPFNEYGFTKFRNPKTRKRAIPKEDVFKIREYATEPESQMFHSQQYFMFSYYNRGINFSDLARLKWSDIQYGRLHYTRTKSKQQYSIGLLEPAQAILDYYKKYYYSGQDSYIFPILNPDYPSEASIRNRIKKMLRQVNKDLKTIAESLGIEELNLTTYVARHSYATALKKSGQSIGVISQALGHSSEKTTQIYLDSFENDVIDEASKAIL